MVHGIPLRSVSPGLEHGRSESVDLGGRLLRIAQVSVKALHKEGRRFELYRPKRGENRGRAGIEKGTDEPEQLVTAANLVEARPAGTEADEVSVKAGKSEDPPCRYDLASGHPQIGAQWFGGIKFRMTLEVNDVGAPDSALERCGRDVGSQRRACAKKVSHQAGTVAIAGHVVSRIAKDRGGRHLRPSSRVELAFGLAETEDGGAWSVDDGISGDQGLAVNAEGVKRQEMELAIRNETEQVARPGMLRERRRKGVELVQMSRRRFIEARSWAEVVLERHLHEAAQACSGNLYLEPFRGLSKRVDQKDPDIVLAEEKFGQYDPPRYVISSRRASGQQAADL